MLLGFTFIIALFSSLGWLVFCYHYLQEKIQGVDVFSLGAIDLLVCTVIVVLPILTIWAIFGFISSYVSNRTNNTNFKNLFEQLKRNQDYSDLMARALIETESKVRAGNALSRINDLVSDMNEFLSDIMHVGGVAREEIHNAWVGLSRGEKWSICRLFLAKRSNDAGFQAYLSSKTNYNNKGSVLDFCERYKKALSIIEKYDREKIYQEIIEEGSLGKIYAILSPVADIESISQIAPKAPIAPELKEKKTWFTKEKSEPAVEKDPFYMFLKNENQDKKKPFTTPNLSAADEEDIKE